MERLVHADLTPGQQGLHDEVLSIAGCNGADCKDVLDEADASLVDKAAVAEVLGGPGAGAEYLREQVAVAGGGLQHDDDAAEM